MRLRAHKNRVKLSGFVHRCGKLCAIPGAPVDNFVDRIHKCLMYKEGNYDVKKNKKIYPQNFIIINRWLYAIAL